MSPPGDLPRVVFVNRVYPPSEAATAQLLADLAASLAARGWPVHVVATGPADTISHGVAVHCAGPTRSHSGLVAQASNYRRFVAAARPRLAGLLRRGDVVVPMTDPPLLAVAVADAAARAGAILVPWIQDIYPEILSAHAGAWLQMPLALLRRRRDRAWRAARLCTTVSPEMAAAIERKGVAPERVRVIPNWAPVELDTPAAPAAIAAQRASWGFADQFVVAYSGNLGRVHEFDTVLAAAERLRQRQDIAFAFIGEGARLAAVRAAAARSALPNVRFLPAQPRARLAVSLAAADAHLVTLRPGFGSFVSPSKLPGALAAGRPVLFVGPEGSAAELVRGAGAGECFAPGEDARLAATIAAWSADRPALINLGERARAAHARSFTLGAAVAAWEELLRLAARRD